MKNPIEQTLTRLMELERLIEEHKALYAERDALTLLLVREGFKDAEYEGKTFVLTDTFADSNVGYRVAFVRRFEVKIKDKK